MGKGAYIGVEGVARKVKKIYVGIDGVARRIKKAYIGIGGVARPCFVGSDLDYYGTTEKPLNGARYGLVATTIANHALFSGGYQSYQSGGVASSKWVGNVDAYDTSLTQKDLTPMYSNVYGCKATTVGNYALFCGGFANKSYAYDASLTQKDTVQSLREERGWCSAATTVGNHALFGGVSVVDAYDTSLTRKDTVQSLREERGYFAATTVGNHALFGGGSLDLHSDYRDTVDAYDVSLTRKDTVQSLRVARSDIAATTVGNHALFGGGMHFYVGDFGNSHNQPTTSVDAYDTSLTRKNVTSLGGYSAGDIAATTVGNYALFSGDGSLMKTYAYDTSLTQKVLSKRIYRNQLAATTVGNYALFGGGMSTTTLDASNLVDVFEFNKE